MLDSNGKYKEFQRNLTEFLLINKIKKMNIVILLALKFKLN